MTTDLTFVERTTLLVLMAESRPVKLTELKTISSELKSKPRENLRDLGLISVTTVGRGMAVELTDQGWARAAEEFGADPLAAAGRSGGKTLYTLLRALRRYFDRHGIEPNEVFLPSLPDTSAADTEVFKAAEVEPTNDSTVDTDANAPAIDDVEGTIVSAYHRLASEPNAWVSLRRLRVALSSIDRAEVDNALGSLYRDQHINLIPEANQRELTADDRGAALHIGGQSRHMMKIDR